MTELDLIQNLDLIVFNKVNDRYFLNDASGFSYALSYDNLKVINRRGSSPAKFYRNNPFTINNISKYLLVNNIPITLVSSSTIYATEKLVFNCYIHGQFNKSWNEIKNGQFCPYCGTIERNENRKKDFEFIISEFLKEGYRVVSKFYINNESPIEYVCASHEEKGSQFITWGNFISGKRCRYCSRERITKVQAKQHNKFVEEIRDIFGDSIKVLGEYVNCKTKIHVYCTVCDTEFHSKPNHLLKGHLGCLCSSYSLGENMIKNYLDLNNINYLQQYRFKNCRNKRPLPFDFAIFDETKENILFLIEFQGKQHYENTQWSSDPQKSELEYINRVKNDNIKRKFCLDNNIHLVEIPYWEIQNISKIIDHNFNQTKEMATNESEILWYRIGRYSPRNHGV